MHGCSSPGLISSVPECGVEGKGGSQTGICVKGDVSGCFAKPRLTQFTNRVGNRISQTKFSQNGNVHFSSANMESSELSQNDNTPMASTAQSTRAFVAEEFADEGRIRMNRRVSQRSPKTPAVTASTTNIVSIMFPVESLSCGQSEQWC